MFRNINFGRYNQEIKDMYEMYRVINKKEDMRRKLDKTKQNKKSQAKDSYISNLAKYKIKPNRIGMNTSLRNMLRKSPTRKNKNKYDTLIRNAINLPYSNASNAK